MLALLKQASKEGKRLVAGEMGQSFLAAREKVCGVSKDQLWSPALTYTVE